MVTVSTVSVPPGLPIENRGPQIAGVTIALLALTWTVVLLRCYVRIFMLKAFFLDDWLTLASLILFSGYSGYGLVGVYWGVGQHIYQLPLDNIRMAMQVWYFNELLYTIASATVRVAVGVFLLRFATSQIHKTIIYTITILQLAYSTVFLATEVFQCIPLDHFWNRFQPGAKGLCFDSKLAVQLTLGATVVAAVADWTFGLLPIWIMWDLQLKRAKKLVVCFLLGLGALASAAPVIRIPYIAGLMNEQDFLFATTDVAIWSIVELGVGIVVISLHSLRPLLRKIPIFAMMSTGKSGPSGRPGYYSKESSGYSSSKRKPSLPTHDEEASPARDWFRRDSERSGRSGKGITKSIIVRTDTT